MLIGKVDKLVCLGKNYLAHAKELQKAIGDQVHDHHRLPATDFSPVPDDFMQHPDQPYMPAGAIKARPVQQASCSN